MKGSVPDARRPQTTGAVLPKPPERPGFGESTPAAMSGEPRSK